MATQMAAPVRHEYPHLTILARAHSVEHTYDLMRAGVEHLYRETMDSALPWVWRLCASSVSAPIKPCVQRGFFAITRKKHSEDL
jgi:hypothetical protein